MQESEDVTKLMYENVFFTEGTTWEKRENNSKTTVGFALSSIKNGHD